MRKKLTDILTKSQLQLCLDLRDPFLIHQYVTSPNIQEISERAEENLDPKLLAYAIEHAIFNADEEIKRDIYGRIKKQAPSYH